MSDRPAPPHVAHYHGLLGTVVEVRIHGADADVAEAAERVVVDEMRRLERVFSVYDEASTLRRWRSGEIDDAGPELGALLATALAWQRRSDGAFNPFTGALMQRWRQAEIDGAPPGDAELAALADAIRAPRLEVDASGLRRTGDCGGLDLNALAKGAIVDAAVAALDRADGIDAVVVNAGGDLVHRGAGTVRVGVENPLRPFDNEPPLAVVALTGAALATSGSARRGFRVGGAWLGHVLDPRTGRPVDHTRSATVQAPDAATADVVATIAAVLTPSEALAIADAVDGVSCLLVDRAGAVLTSRRWPTG